MQKKLITRTIRLLSLVSLLADLASQMLYPILPLYLQGIGFSIVLIGLLEGIAEVTAGLGRGYVGRLSNQPGRRLPLVRLGYTLSALAKPLLVLFALPVWVVATRIVDRFGKGLRTTPRDTLLADEAAPQSRNQVFGFHRSANWLGAVLGPVAALVYLYFFPGQYVALFLLAFGPGLLAAGLTFRLSNRLPQPPPQSAGPTDQPASVSAFAQYWRQSPPEYRQVMGGLLVFSLLRSSDVFLLLKLKEVGLSDTVILGLYVFYNLVYAGVAQPIGQLVNRIGFRPTLLVGLGLFAFVYEGMAVADQLPAFVGLLALYGLYAAATEGIAKAWISAVSGPWHTATAVGTYAGLSSVGALMANVLAGVLWYAFGAGVMFAVTGIATLWVVLYVASLEEVPDDVTAVRKPGVVINTDGDLTGSDLAPYIVEHQPSAPRLTRPAYLTLLLLIGSLGIATVYLSYVAISTALTAPAPLTATSVPTDRSGFSPSTTQSTGTPLPADPASSRSLNSSNRSGKSRLPGEYDGSSAPTDSSGFWPSPERSAAVQRRATSVPISNPTVNRPPNSPNRPGKPVLAGKFDTGSAATNQSGLPPSTGQPMASQRPANPAGGNSPNGPNRFDEPSLTGGYGSALQTKPLGIPSSIADVLTAKRPPVPWLKAPVQSIAIKGISAGKSAEELAGRLTKKVVSPRPAARRPVRLYTVAALYTHVYERPAKRSRKKPFLNIGKKVVLTALMEKNGFIYVIYSTRKGQTRKGWLPKQAVRLVRLPSDLYSS